MWNPLPPPVDPAAERAAAHRETASRARAVEDDPAPSDESSVDSEQEEEEESVEEAEVGRERARSSSLARGALGGADNNRRPPWEEDPPSPVARRNRTRRRAATDVVDADEDGVQASRRVSSAHPEPARRPAAATGWFERMNGIAAGGDEAMPSAERLVVSILQASDHSAGLYHGLDKTRSEREKGWKDCARPRTRFSALLCDGVAPFFVEA